MIVTMQVCIHNESNASTKTERIYNNDRIIPRYILCNYHHSDPCVKVNPLSVVKYSGEHVWVTATTWKHTKGHKANQDIISNERTTGITLSKQYILYILMPLSIFFTPI